MGWGDGEMGRWSDGGNGMMDELKKFMEPVRNFVCGA
jgi:hypothetical protein